MRRRLLAFAFSIVLCAGAVLRPAVAAPSSESGAIALKKFEEGKQAYDAGRFEEALAAFQASLELQPSPNSRLYIGRCLRALGKTASAFTSLRLSAREAQDRLTASGEKRYGATRDAANEEAAELEPKVPYVTVATPSDPPPDFKVTLDGADLPASVWGTALPLDAGTHVVAARGRRMAPFDEKVQVKDGDKRRVAVRAERLPTALLSVRFAVRPSGLAVQIDGAPTDPDLATATREVDPGNHVVEAQAPGYRRARVVRALRDRDEATVTIALEPLPAARATNGGTPPWMFISVAATSVAALGAGTYFALSSSSAANAETAKNPLLRDPDVQSRVRSQATVANVLFVAGGALAVGSGVLLFTTRWGDPQRERPAEVRVSGALTPGGGGVAVRGAF